MTEEFVIGIARDTFYTVFIVSAPVLLVSVVVGLLISIFQAATSISEMTLTFVPKIIAIGVVLILLLPFMMEKFLDFTKHIFEIIPTLR
ncbi:MAG: flagellar biosynthesis protein FliQ [Candidatus Kryptoniota bacterium]